MSKEVKTGVRQGDGEPEYRWNVINVEQDLGEAATTMAVGIVMDRLRRLPVEDLQSVYRLVEEGVRSRDPEEVEAIRVTLQEILAQRPSGMRGLDLNASRPGKLQKWVDFVAEKVVLCRKSAGLTQTELARKSGLPQSHISRIESGKLSPSRITLEKIARALGRRMSEFDPSA